MNQQQREYLLKEVKIETDKKREAIKNSVPDYPDIQSICITLASTGELKLKPKSDIETYIYKLTKQGQTSEWLEGISSFRVGGKRVKVSLHWSKILDLPDSVTKQIKEWEELNNKAEEQLKVLNAELRTLEMRIKLASPKTLDKLISEIDDMGELTLMDAKLKQLTS